MKLRINLLALFMMLATFVNAVTLSSSASSHHADNKYSLTIGIAWRSDSSSEFYKNVEAAFGELGVKTVLLKQVKNKVVAYRGNDVSQTDVVVPIGYLSPSAADALKKDPYKDSNVKKVLKGIDAVVFTGGEDISPTLLKEPQPWHGIEAEKDYNATRDVNDYTLMSYCISKNVSAIGFCRGMQMLGVVAGASVIQDIPTYFKEKGETYNYVHRNEKVGNAYRDYAAHDVQVEANTILSEMTTTPGMFHHVPSWHHQSLRSVDGTSLKVSGYTLVNGEKMIEGIEASDCSLVMGLQFHPEAAIAKWQNKAENASQYMTKEEALKIFKVFIDKVKARKQNASKVK